MKKIQELKTSQATYTIAYNYRHKLYFAINNEDLDENGRLTNVYNGIKGCASAYLDNCIKGVTERDKVKELIAQGYSQEEAFKQVYKF